MEISRKMIKHPYWIYPIINLEFKLTNLNAETACSNQNW